MISSPFKRFFIQLTLTFIVFFDNTLAVPTCKYLFPSIIPTLYHKIFIFS